MFSSPVDYQKPNPRRVSSRSPGYLNTIILAFVISIAIAFLATTPDKESEMNPTPPGRATSTGLIDDNSQDGSSAAKAKVVQTKLPLREPIRFLDRVMSAFNDPFLIDYANQQGLDIPDSATLLNNAAKSPIPSRVPSSQSSRSSSN